MSDIIELLKLASQGVSSLFAGKKANKEGSWQEVTLALDKLVELTLLHVKAIGEVTAPILNSGDLAETSRRYSALVNNPDFPQGYETIRGILSAAKKMDAFREPAIQQGISAVLDELYKFQYGVFTLAWDSYRVSDAFANAAQALEKENVSQEELQAISRPFVHSFSGVFLDAVTGLAEGKELTAASVKAFLQSWCQAWQRYIQRILYDHTGLNYHIAQLRMRRHQ